jgi:hypothetical protein
MPESAEVRKLAKTLMGKARWEQKKLGRVSDETRAELREFAPIYLVNTPEAKQRAGSARDTPDTKNGRKDAPDG